ncbi:uncharacterized protein LOC107809699 isoform X2 [Nicotiana tabacum]|uniref:CD2 antigen cytoplasmic tail-binding protein 2-like isoform X2 n=1 Tax=Nicotiana tabacum TaxID=4097 RepID=A0A1S4BLV3_TOBAC|nr:PREDICTED: CD2 antigen cytoplasmic tail-binding protein 2-like isoform X2 [Nicotiana tabacum]
MEEGSSRRSKRPFVDVEDDDSKKAPAQKRVRFPKGKKVKQGDNTIEGREDLPSAWRDPRLAAKERSVRRNQITAELLDEENEGEIADISQAEVEYGEHETFIDDGIAIEPFNLDKEREEGYFDAAGNYVEYLNENEIKDAWLDSVDTEKRFFGKSAIRISNEDEIQDLTAEELGMMKRRIADVLEPGETVLQALRRLKGTSNNKKCKMSAETKQLFDQLTEDAMKLMENGDHNVYDEKQESFQREAEGYEKLAQARQGKSIDSMQPKPDNVLDEHFLPSGSTATAGGHSMHNADEASSNSYNSANKSDDAYDMFGEDDENVPANPASNGGDQHGDYVFDESSGYVFYLLAHCTTFSLQCADVMLLLQQQFGPLL